MVKIERLWFFDLDDFLLDFSGAFLREFGVKCRSIASTEVWEKLHAHPTFFRDLELAPGAREFWERYKHLNPIILSACSESHYIEGATQKRENVRRHFGSSTIFLPCRGGKFKQLFMHAPGDVLVDDHKLNIERWNAAGGDGILHVPHDFDSTSEAMERILAQDKKVVRL